MSINTEQGGHPLKGFDWLALPRLDSLKKHREQIDAVMSKNDIMTQMEPNAELARLDDGKCLPPDLD